jgi:hypothetical protein
MGITKHLAPIKFGISPLISSKILSIDVFPPPATYSLSTNFVFPPTANRQPTTDNPLKAEVCAYCAATDPRPAVRYRRNT